MLNKIKSFKYTNSIINLVLGLFLVIFNKSIYSIIFELIGAYLVIVGIFHLLKYYLNKKNNILSNNLLVYKGVLSIFIALFVLFFGETLSKFLLIIFIIYLLISSFINLKDLMTLVKYHKHFIYELIPALLKFVLLVYVLFNLNKSIEIITISIGIYLIIKALTNAYKIYNNYKDVIEINIIEK